ncbi:MULTISPECIES: serine hydrolase [unclassified Fusibacter]|uniref:serine hydrolase domain-containing protein n=1 Tax=unclassified Fusibacter TaxID=2624464 RepID=UPI001010C1F3|nr:MULTISPECIES: serine hydrolase [unclassified Fusibacter]MCK8058486.1 beta-lactamase family protein [Fusibacter sp. A2]NPE22745.1 serine hydrolase [Fusibacter sp. A1]RXV60304.1 class C beta-lactamase-related serine hydrolase [Fusibacter sp. A1]
MNRRFERAKPEEQGVSSTALVKLIEGMKRQMAEKEDYAFHSVMILRHGKVIAEGSFAPFEQAQAHLMFSLSKSFTSTAIGISVEEGLLSLDDKVIDFFPEMRGIAKGTYTDDLTIRHLLCMSAGQDQENMMTGNWVEAFFSQPISHAPGTKFMYNTLGTYILSAILQKVSGTTLEAYLEPRLFEPLGIREHHWHQSPQGISAGGFGLMINVEDIAAFGQLYLNKGVFNGKRILSERYVTDATSVQIANGEDVNSDWTQGYGYQFWMCRNGAYRGDGAYGQYCLVMPDEDMVIGITAGLSDLQAPLDLIFETLIGEVSDVALPPSDKSFELSQMMKSLMIEFAADKAEYAVDFEGDFSLSEALYGCSDIYVKLSEKGLELSLRNEYSHFEINTTIGEWSKTKLFFLGGEMAASAAGAWIGEGTYRLEIRFTESAVVDYYEFKIGDVLSIHYKRWINHWETRDGIIEMIS